MTLDIDILRAVNGASGSHPLLDTIMILGAFLGQTHFLFLGSIPFILDRRYRTGGILWSAAAALSGIIVLIVKPIVARPRPFLTHDWVVTIWSHPSSYSFPSGHTSQIVACTLVVILLLVSRLREKRMGQLKFTLCTFILVMIALVVSVGRIYLGVHYPSDVLAGAGVGIVSAVFVFLGYRKRKSIFRAFKKAIP